jgi:hypothetical protein
MMRVLVALFFGLVLLIRPLVVPAVVLVTVFVAAAGGRWTLDPLQSPIVWPESG